MRIFLTAFTIATLTTLAALPASAGYFGTPTGGFGFNGPGPDAPGPRPLPGGG